MLLEAFDEKALIEEEQEERKKEWRTDSTDLIHRFLRPWKRSTPPRRAFVFYTSLFHLKNDGRPGVAANGNHICPPRVLVNKHPFGLIQQEKLSWEALDQIGGSPVTEN